MRKPHLIFTLLCAVSVSFGVTNLNFGQTPSEDKRSSESSRRLNKDEAIARLQSDPAQRSNLVVSFEAGVPAATLKKTLAQKRVQQVQAFYQWGNHRGGYGVREAQTLQESLTDFENRHLQFLQRQIQNLSNSATPAVVKLDFRHVVDMERARQELLDEFMAQLELFNQKGLVISRLVAEDSADNLISLVEAFSADGVGFQVGAVDVNKSAPQSGKEGDAPERLVTPTTASANPPYPNNPWKFSPARGRVVYDSGTEFLTSFFSFDDVSGFDKTHIAYEHDITIFRDNVLDAYVIPARFREWHSNLPTAPKEDDGKPKEGRVYADDPTSDKHSSFTIGTAAATALKVGSLYFTDVPVEVLNRSHPPTTGALQPQLGSWAGEYDAGGELSEAGEELYCQTNLKGFPYCIFSDQHETIINYFNDSGVFRNFPFDHRVSTTFFWDRNSQTTPPALECPQGSFKAEYRNRSTGSLLFARCESAPINHDWGSGGPGAGPEKDDLLVEWTGRFSFPAGKHRFIASSDDGIRVFVDDVQIIDGWKNRSETEDRGEWEATTSGVHTVKVEYYEAAGNAVARLRWELIGGSNTCQASVAADRWKGEYFNNTALSGTPVMVRDDSDVAGGTFFAHNWGTGSPNSGCGIGVDNFSARWTRRQNFDAGRYSFTVRADDGVRFFVDNVLRIDQWRDQGATNYTVDVDLTAGNHDLRVEYYEHGANAVAQIFWQRAGGNVAPTINKATFNTPIAGQPFGGTITGTGFVVSGTEVWFCPTNGSNCLQHPAAGVIVDTPTTLRVFNVRLSNGAWQVFVKTAAGASGHSAPFTVELAPANCIATVAADRWKAEYFNNRDLSGAAAMVRDDSDVAGGPFFAHDWGTGSPNVGCGMAADDFSVRWTRRQSFSAGRYRFTVRADDGVRLFVDNVLRIDQWRDQGATNYTVEIDLTSGNHDLRMEYYEHSGNAVAQIFWDRTDGGVPNSCVSTVAVDHWKGEYFNNRFLSGTPVMVRDDSDVAGGTFFAHDWGTGSPNAGCGVAVDDFSVRWTRQQSFAAGRYSFTVRADDGVRLFVDNVLRIDQWRDQGATNYTVEVDLSSGNHDLRMEYYEHGANAVAQIFWQRVGAGSLPSIGGFSLSPNPPTAGQNFNGSVSGTNFVVGGTELWFCPLNSNSCVQHPAAGVTVNNSGSLSFVNVKLSSGSWQFFVKTAAGQSARSSSFSVQAGGAVPTIGGFSLTPTSPTANQNFNGSVSGTNFVVGATELWFCPVNSNSCVQHPAAGVTVNNSGSLSFVNVKLSSGSWQFFVKTVAGQSARSSSFNVQAGGAVPTIGGFSLTPTSPTANQNFNGSVSGTNFVVGATELWFCPLNSNSCVQHPAAGVTVNNSGSLSFVNVKLSSGSWQFFVKTAAGQSARSSSFSVQAGGAIPTIGGFSLSPTSPTANQNFNGSVSGTNFVVGATELWFCPVNSNSCVQHPAAGVTVNNSGSLSFVNVKLSSGSWQFFVKTAAGQSARSSSFNVQAGGAIPTISGFSLTPTSPTANQNFNGSVSGTNFVVGATELWFCPLNSNSCVQHPAAGVTVNNSGSLSFVNVKLGSGLWQFFLKTTAGQSARSSSFNVQAGAPTISGFSLSPTSPTAGQNFNGSVSGTNFVVGATELWFCPVNSNSCVQHPAAGVTVNNSGSLSFVNVKLGSGSWQFFLKTAAGQSARSSSFNVQAGAPTISGFSLSPTSPTAGQNFNGSVSGTNFVVGATELWFCPVNSNSCVQHPAAGVTVNNSGSLSFVNVKLGSGSWQFFLKTAAGQSARSSSFNVQAGAPTISSFSLNQNPPTAGQNFNGSVSGTNFVVGATELWFCPVNSSSCNQHPAAGVTVNNSSSLSFVNVKVGSGSWQFFLKTAAGSSARSSSFFVQAGAPTISGFSLNQNPPTANQNFNGSVSGSNFVAGATELWFCPVNSSSCNQHPSAGVTVNNSGSLSFVNVKLGSGSWQFFLKTAAGSSARSSSFFVQAGAPTISGFSLNPNTPTANQNFDGSVSGSNFVAGATELWFCPVNSSSCNQHPAAGVTVNNSGSLSFVNVKVGSGSWQFFLKTAAGSSARSSSFFVQAGAPTISGFSLNQSPPTANQNFNGSVSGSNFVAGATELWFCPVNSSSCNQHPSAGVTVNNSGSLSFVNVKLGSGSWQFFLKTAAGQSARSSSFFVQAGAPTISGFSLNQNPPTANQNFNGSVSGSNFVAGGTELWFCPVNSSSCNQHPSAGVTVNNSGSLSFVNVKVGSGSWQFFLKTAAGSSARSSSFFVQAGAPTISGFSLNPNPPPANQNFNGSVSGSNFVVGATELWFCPVNSSSCNQHPSVGVTVNNSSSLSFVNVRLSSGLWQFFLRTGNGQSSRSGSFSVQ